MLYEKIIKRDDGSKVKILVQDFEYPIPYFTNVSVCRKNKRTYNDVTINSHEFRTLSFDCRLKADLINQLSVVSELELYDAKICAWQSMKPKI